MVGTIELQCLGLLGPWPPLWIGIFANPTVEIDGDRAPSSWGTRNYALAPGLHTIAVSYPWLFQPQVDRAQLTVEIVAERTITLRYRAGGPIYFPGTLKIIDQVALARVHKQ
ncbi:MAG: hypothetical protein KBG15_13335 [Kofleriaceae bacterium]|nr:hypothetical protein [Kofleriaceae bacterium]